MIKTAPSLFLTGGTGFVGRALLKQLAEMNPFTSGITLLTRDADSFRRRYPQLAAMASFVEGDIRDFRWPDKTFSHVIHAATATDMDAASRPRNLIDTIVRGTANALDFASHCGAEKFLFLSSGAIYGRQPPDLMHIPEDYEGAPATTDPSSSYGNGKRLAEQLCINSVRPGFCVTIARLFAFVGEDLPLDTHFAIGNFIRDALSGKIIRIHGDGSPVRSYLYQADLAHWLLGILDRGESGRAYNVGSDEAIDLASLAELVADTVHPGLTVEIAKSRSDYSGRLRYVPDISRAKRELGLGVETSLRDAIRRTASS